MKILHTADWHLGQRFCERDRIEEHAAFLRWLINIVSEHEIDALIHAGDVFDAGTPPNYSVEMYYTFLRDLVATKCKNIIITGGNHDSPAMLNAPRELLRSFNIHAIGAKSENFADDKIILQSDANAPIGVVCAVPYLRDRDIRFSVPGETAQERENRIRDGIAEHYKRAAILAESEKLQGLPIIATGHLFAAGGEISDAEHPIIGNLGAIDACAFPDIFDYIALGHIHRPQIVGGKRHIRYSGSPIPLSFKETEHKHQVVIAEFNDGTLTGIETPDVPVLRRLLHFSGTPDEIIDKINKFNSDDLLTAWAEISANSTEPRPQFIFDAHEAAKDKRLNLLKIVVSGDDSENTGRDAERYNNLQDVTTNEVFRLRCETAGYTPEKTSEIEATFNELLSLLQEREQ